MSDSPRVSVVINNYNYGRFLAASIDSALAQSYPFLEVVVVDDGSTDDSLAVIARYGDRVKVVAKPNGGQGSAFNAGFEASSGAIVMYLDADDMLMPTAVERVAAAWRPGVANVQFRLQVIDRDGIPKPLLVPRAGLPLTTGDAYRVVLSGRTYVSPFTSGHAFAREALTKILPLPAEDWRITADCYLMTLAPFCGTVVSIDEPLGYYRIHGGNNWTSDEPGISLDDMLREIRYTFKRTQLIREWCAPRGLVPHPHLPFQRAQVLSYMVAVKVLDRRRDPLPERSLYWLCRRGVRVLLGDTVPNFKKRAAFMAWFAAIAISPRFLAARLVAWRHLPGQRPAVFKRLSPLTD